MFGTFRDYVILTSEGEDQGFWVDLRAGNTQYQAYPLGIEKPGPSALTATAVHDGHGQLTAHITYKYLITYYRAATMKADDDSELPAPFYGAESELGQVVEVNPLRSRCKQ